MTTPLLLGLDFGGTKLTASVARSGEKELLGRDQCPTPQVDTARPVFEVMVELARRVLRSADGRPSAVGVSFGGPVDAAAGRVRTCHHLPGWEDVPLREWVETAFDAPAVVENDANAAAVGEWRCGAGRGCDDLLYITVSTGVGGGLVLDGRLRHGADSLAGEIGHMTVQPGGPLCTCGRRGCLEALASGPYIAQRARELLQEDPRRGGILRLLADDEGPTGAWHAITAEMVSRAAVQGDELARQALGEAATALGMGIAMAATLINPELVILGGGVIKAGEPFLSVVRSAAGSNVMPGISVSIAEAALGDDAPLWGAIALAGNLCYNLQQ